MIGYILLLFGIVLTILGLIFGLRTIDTKIYNLLVAIMLGVFAVFGFFGKYNQEVKSGENLSKISSTANETYKNTEKTNSELDELRDENQIMLKKYEALVTQNETLKEILDQQTIKMDIESQIRQNNDRANLKASIREYSELEQKYSVHAWTLFDQFVGHRDEANVRSMMNELALTGNDILRARLVSENDDLYNQWELLNTEISPFYNFA